MSHNRIGPTGRFPRGRIGPHDEGEIQLAISTDVASQTIILHFGKATAWIGLGVAEARALADVLVKHADRLTKP